MHFSLTKYSVKITVSITIYYIYAVINNRPCTNLLTTNLLGGHISLTCLIIPSIILAVGNVA